VHGLERELRIERADMSHVMDAGSYDKFYVGGDWVAPAGRDTITEALQVVRRLNDR
jgi:hypothetical protein